MHTYNIYMPPESGPQSDLADAVYLPDNKAWLAALAPPIWLIWHRLWWALTVYIIYLILVFLLLLTPWQYAVSLLSAIPALYLLLEGRELVRQRYENRGWGQIGVVQANSEEDAVIRYTFSRNGSKQERQSGEVDFATTGTTKRLQANSDAQNNTRNSIGIFPLEPSA